MNGEGPQWEGRRQHDQKTLPFMLMYRSTNGCRPSSESQIEPMGIAYDFSSSHAEKWEKEEEKNMLIRSRLARFLLFHILFWGLFLVFFSNSFGQDTTPPTVVSTCPANGAANVSGKTRSVSISFSEPMGPGVNMYSNWGGTAGLDIARSEDRTVLYITRKDTTPIPNNEIIYFVLNPGPSENPIVDMAGNELERYEFSFVTGADNISPTVVSTYPANGTVGVSLNLAGISVTFSEEMSTAISSYTTDFEIWGTFPGAPGWAPDHRTLYIPRNAAVALPVGVTVTFKLMSLRDLEGNLLGDYTFSFLVGTDVDLMPAVVSTIPANGATGVSRDLQTVSISFSEPMNPGAVSIATDFPEYSLSWDTYHTVLTLTRSDTLTKLPGGVTFGFILNGAGYENFRDTQGNFLPETSFSFTVIEQYDYELVRVSEDSAKGFFWPYFLCIPNDLRNRTVLLVEPNNTGALSDDLAVHEASANALVRMRSDFAIALDVPLLVPIFPRPASFPDIYTHALDRYSLLTTAQLNGKSLARIDLQLMAMMSDAKQRLSARGVDVAEKIFMIGFSASGAFTSRFTAIHPDLVMACAPGSPGGWPLAPVPSWQGANYRYPVGIFDLATLTGSSFDLNALRNVPQYIYVGNLDQNDALDTREFPPDEKNAICALLDCRPNPYISDRWPIAEEIYDSVQASAEFKVYPDVGHTITGQMLTDILQFFEKHDTTRIDLAEIISILKAVSGLAPSLDDLTQGDVNGDGRIGLEEAVYMLQRAAGER